MPFTYFSSVQKLRPSAKHMAEGRSRAFARDRAPSPDGYRQDTLNLPLAASFTTLLHPTTLLVLLALSMATP